MIHIARGVQLPLEAVTKTFGFMGIRESGKTYAATKLAEGMFQAGGQIVALDPVGKWWGLRVGKDGKSPGLDIPVFGGLRGDLPLHESSGGLVARTVVETGTSVILDVSQMRKGKRKQFVTEFCEELFHLRAAEPAATHVFFEEAHTFAPERASGQERMLGAVSDIIRLGRNHGLGATLIDQRPQSVSKDVLNQTECLFAMRMVGKHERKAIQDWIVHAGVDIGGMADELPSLDTGEAMLWSPSWLRLFKRIKILQKKTFDASATPKVGRKLKATKLKPLDMADLQTAMSSMVQEVENADPKFLKAKVKKLEAQLAAKSTDATNRVQKDDAAQVLRAENANLKQEIKGLQKAMDEGRMFAGRVMSDLKNAVGLVQNAYKNAEKATNVDLIKPKRQPVMRSAGNTVAQSKRVATMPLPSEVRSSSQSGGEQKILDAIAWWERVGEAAPTRRQVGFVAGYTMNGYFNNVVSKMRTKGIIEYPEKGKLALVNRSFANYPTAQPTQGELHRLVFAQLKSAESKILVECIAQYPVAIDRESLAAACGYTQNGYFNNTISKMKTLGFVTYPDQGQVAATELLFL